MCLEIEIFSPWPAVSVEKSRLSIQLDRTGVPLAFLVLLQTIVKSTLNIEVTCFANRNVTPHSLHTQNVQEA